MTENIFIDIFLETASSDTPISSGNGEAIINPAATGNKYFLKMFGVLWLIYKTTFSFDNFLISSAKECLIKLKMNKSPIKAPIPPIKLARYMF